MKSRLVRIKHSLLGDEKRLMRMGICDLISELSFVMHMSVCPIQRVSEHIQLKRVST